jgi:hypothetical protein
MTSINELNNLQPGQKLVYWVGASIAKSSNKELRGTAYNLHLEDRAFLVQRRIDGGLFEYIAIGKIAPPNKKRIEYRRHYVTNLASKPL